MVEDLLTHPGESDDDAILVSQHRAGDRRAFDELVRKYQRRVYGLTLRYVRNREDAKDLAQRAFVRAFEAIDGFRGGSSFRTWLYRIAINLALNHLRDHKPQVEVDAALDEQCWIPAVGDARIVDDETRRALLRALDELPPKQRLVLELRVYEELPFREVATIARCSENAAKVTFHHAVKRLRAVMERNAT